MNHEEPIDLTQMNKDLFMDIYKQNADVAVFSKQYEIKQQFRSYNSKSIEIIFIMNEFMIDKINFKETILPTIDDTVQATSMASIQEILQYPKISWFSLTDSSSNVTVRMMSNYLFDGNILCAIPSLQTIMTINCSKIPQRQTSESAAELSILGPADGFIEDIGSNIALLRKRIRNEALTIESYTIGTLTDTKLALLYMNNIANDQLIATIKKRIDQIDIESLVTIGELEELVGDKTYLFPTMDYSARPDFITNSLLQGRFVLILDNNPTALIAPGNFFQLLHSPEDSYFPMLASNIGHIFRLLGLFISIFLPSFYIALATFHPDQIPFELLATISLSRIGLPMESAIEMFLIVSIMELFREATLRLPSRMSQTITVVGGLIMGEAAIRAGLISPMMVVVSAIAIITGSTLVNQALTSSVVFFRFISYLFGATFGIYGFIISYVLFILFLSRLHSFGIPYLAPLSPLNFKNLIISLFQTTLSYRNIRPNYLHTKKNKKDD